MKKFYTLILSVLALATVSAAYAEDLGTKYNGTITINMGDDPVVLTDQSVYIKSESATTCTFALYDFKLTAEMPEPMGNIVVPNVAITNGENYSQTYAGSVNDIYLTVETPNDIHANATISGTELGSGRLHMQIDVLWLMDETTQIPIPVTFDGLSEDLGTKYNGTISINMGDEPVVIPDQSVYLKSRGGAAYSFALYDFKLSPEMPAPMGDIFVPQVTSTSTFEGTSYEGSVKDIYLTVETPNDIHANADIKATETTSGALTANIAVLWLMDETTQIPISVTFNGAKEQSQGSVATIATSNAKAYGAASAIAITNYTGNAEVYTIAGQLVKSVKVNGLAKVDMPAGLYIVRLGENASKVVVK